MFVHQKWPGKYCLYKFDSFKELFVKPKVRGVTLLLALFSMGHNPAVGGRLEGALESRIWPRPWGAVHRQGVGRAWVAGAHYHNADDMQRNTANPHHGSFI